MNTEVKEDILDILNKSLSIIKKENPVELDALSNHTIHDASIFQDHDSVSIAVIIYALAKLMRRKETGSIKNWHILKKRLIKQIGSAHNFLNRGKEKMYREVIKDIIRKISEVDDHLKIYIDDVLDKAKIVKGSRIYEHGVSLERAAEVLGISQWELLSYVGKTKIVDRYIEEVIPITKRIAYAKKIFNIR